MVSWLTGQLVDLSLSMLVNWLVYNWTLTETAHFTISQQVTLRNLRCPWGAKCYLICQAIRSGLYWSNITSRGSDLLEIKLKQMENAQDAWKVAQTQEAPIPMLPHLLQSKFMSSWGKISWWKVNKIQVVKGKSKWYFQESFLKWSQESAEEVWCMHISAWMESDLWPHIVLIQAPKISAQWYSSHPYPK